MLRAFSNIPIFRRLVITFLIATLIPIFVILLLGNFSLQSSAVRSQAVQTSFDAQNTATQQQINLERMNALLQARFAQVFAQGNADLKGDPSLRASGALTGTEVGALELDFSQALLNYQQNYELANSSNMSTVRNILISDTPDQGQQIIDDQFNALQAVKNSNWKKYQQEQDKVLQDLAVDNPDYETAYADYYQANFNFLALKNNWQQVVNTATEMGTTVTQIGPSYIDPLLLYIALALVFTLLVITAAGLLINTTIINPLKQMAALTRQIALGDTLARAQIPGRDEIGQVASSINGMLDTMLRLMQEAQISHAELQTQIENMIGKVSGLGAGNLQIQLPVTSDELGVLADSFNVMAEQLNNLVVNVKLLARNVQNATLQIFGTMEQLVDNADMQFQHIAKANEEVHHFTTSSRQVAERAQMLANVALEARQSAQRGRIATTQTVKRIEHINENVDATAKKVTSLGDRSREISSIVEVISGIAQQTNRLALDASIQAAMAGEQGKGFGAVALDIRRLAERSKEQAALVVQIVRNVLEDITATALAMHETERETATSTHIVHEVGKALEQLFSAVEQQASEIEATNQIAMQQLQSSTLAAQMMLRISEMTRQSSMITREVAQYIENLAPLAGQLLTSVEVFKLREDSTPSLAMREYDTPRQLAAPSSPTLYEQAYQRHPSSPYSGNTPTPALPNLPNLPYQPVEQGEWQEQQKTHLRRLSGNTGYLNSWEQAERN